MSRIILGRIVYLNYALPDPNGKAPKNRPYIVVTDNEHIDPDGEIDVVACSTTFEYPLKQDEIELPYGRTCYTRLSTAGVAVGSWRYRIPYAWIREQKTGFVDGAVLHAILAKVVQLAPNPIRTFGDADTDIVPI